MAAGLVDLGPESLNRSNARSIKKRMQLYPKMASRLRQYLVREKSKAGNFGLFALYHTIFLSAVCLTHGQLLAIIKEKIPLTRC